MVYNTEKFLFELRFFSVVKTKGVLPLRLSLQRRFYGKINSKKQHR